MNPHDVLGVTDDMSLEQIREVFINLAKKYHPDKATSPEERISMEKKFKEITYAYNLLKNSKKQDNRQYGKYYYDTSKLDKDIIKKQAKMHIHKGDYNTAINMLNAIDDGNDYELSVLLGLALFKKNKYHSAKLHFKKAIEINPWKAEPYAYLGEIYRIINLEKSAEYYFKEALKLDPKNKLAIKGMLSIKPKGFSLKSLFKKG